jgi:hypothetical protein
MREHDEPWIPGSKLSRRDCVKVAWHEVPGKATITVPSRRERCDLRLCGKWCRADTPRAQGCESGAPPAQTVPYGTGSWYRPFQALRARLPSCGPYGTGRQCNQVSTCGAKALGCSVRPVRRAKCLLRAGLSLLTSHLSLITLRYALCCFSV